MRQKIWMFGCPIDALTMSETVAKIERIIISGTPSQHCPVNASVLVWIQRDGRLSDIIRKSAVVSADGQSLIWASILLGTPLPERVSGPDLMDNLVGLAAKKKYRVFFLGAEEKVGQRMIDLFKEKYLGLQVAGYHHGYFTKDEESNVVALIKKSRADMLFVALNTPQKDYFIEEHINTLQVSFCMGVGGSFDVLSGMIRRAPIWMQQCGLEWFYRFLQEPRRMWKRYLVTNSAFLWMLLKAYVRQKCNI